MTELKRIEDAAYSAFDRKDVGAYKSLDRPQALRRNDDAGEDPDMGYKKPKGSGVQVGGGPGTFTLSDMRNEDKDPVWSAHYDEDKGEIFYYNRITKNSVWDKPKNFDGYDIMSGQGAKRLGDAQ